MNRVDHCVGNIAIVPRGTYPLHRGFGMDPVDAPIRSAGNVRREIESQSAKYFPEYHVRASVVSSDGEQHIDIEVEAKQ